MCILKNTISGMAFFLFILISSAQQPVLHVITHNRTTVTTDPSKGVKLYPSWGVFPGKEKPIRRIVMKVTLGCPDTLPCAHWDYLDPVYLRRAGGKNGTEYNYELSRMLTPYGSIFTPNWQWEWEADVTDFAMLLRDSVEIVYQHSGYETTSVGWAVTIDFAITLGPEIAHPLKITELWHGSYPYGDPANDIADWLKPVSYSTSNESGFQRIRIQHTGHGMDKPRGCSEFCSRWREIYYDGRLTDHKELWKDCGDNPLYPQGGTWIYDRAHWCPGYLQPADIIDIPASTGEHRIEMKMQPYTAISDMNAAENIASYLIEYGPPQHKHDVALEEIIVPSKKARYNRMNPACTRPVIRIRNLGQNTLHSLQIIYGVKGKTKSKFLWKGQLPFYQTTEIVLPGEIPCPDNDAVFEVTITKPNGQKDAWEYDNTLASAYNCPPVIPDRFVVQFLTNNKPKDNAIVITDNSGKIVYHKTPEMLEPGTLYLDTVFVEPGCYTLNLSDTAGDGLEFWYEPESGYGYLRLLDLSGRLIHAFESDCGNGQYYAFRAAPNPPVDTTTIQTAFVLFPRRTKDKITLDYHSDKPVSMEVIITSDGRIAETHAYKQVTQGRFSYDLGYLPKGRYIIEVLMDGSSKFKRRFNLE